MDIPYKCTSAKCPMNRPGQTFTTEAARDLQLICPRCKAALTPIVQLDEIEEKVVTQYPLLIARPMHALICRTDTAAKNDMLQFLLTNLLKYLALIVEAEYLRSPYIDPELTAFLSKDLQNNILVSSWNRFLCKALDSFEKHGHTLFMPEMKVFYATVERDKTVGREGAIYDDYGELVVLPQQQLGKISAVISYRNAVAHNRTHRGEKGDREFRYHFDIVKDILRNMSWCTNYPLFMQHNGIVRKLMGRTSTQESPDLAPDAWRSPLIVFGTETMQSLPLVPFILASRDHLAGREEDDILIFDAATDKTIAYLGPLGGMSNLSETVQQWRQLIESKQCDRPILGQDDISVQTISNRCAELTTRTQKRLGDSQKILPNCYCNRFELESILQAWPSTTYPMLALSGRGGTGKTNLLSHIATEWQNAGKYVLFLRAVDLEGHDLPIAIRGALGLDASISFDQILAPFTASHGVQLLIILDGISEHAARRELLRSILDVAKQMPYKASPSLRILISYRHDDISWMALDEADITLFHPLSSARPATASAADAGSLSLSDDQNSILPPALSVQPLTYLEQKAMWVKYTQQRDYHPRTTFESLEADNPRFLKELRQPLMLRLFLRLYSGKNAPRRISRQELFKAYEQHIRNTSSYSWPLLLRLAGACLESRSPAVDINTLYEGQQAAPASVYRGLVRAGILLETSDGVAKRVAFVLDDFIEYATAAFLLDEGRANIAAQLIEFCQKYADYPPMYGTLKHLLVAKTRRDGGTLIREFTEGGKREAQIAGTVIGELLLADSLNPERTIHAILGHPSENSILTAQTAANVCIDALNYSTAYQLLSLFWQSGLHEMRTTASAAYLETLGAAAVHTGRFDEAMKSYEMALGILQEVNSGEKTDSVAACYFGMGAVHRELGDLEQALGCYKQSLEIWCNTHGSRHYKVAMTYNNMAIVTLQAHDHAAAAQHCQQALQIWNHLNGPKHLGIAQCINLMAHIHHAAGNLSEALEYARQAFDSFRNALGERHPEVAKCHGTMALIYKDSGNLDQAMESNLRALDIFRHLDGERNLDVAACYASMRDVCKRQRNDEQALEFGRKCLAIYTAVFGLKHDMVAICSKFIADEYYEAANYIEALKHYQNALNAWTALGVPTSLSIAQCSFKAGEILLRTGKSPKNALPLFERALGIFRTVHGENHSDVARCCLNIAGISASTGNTQSALKLSHEALRILCAAHGEKHIDVGRCYFNIASLLTSAGNVQQALEYARTGLKTMEQVLDSRDPQLTTYKAIVDSIGRRIDDGSIH